MPQRVRAVATVAGMAPLERPGHVTELGLWLDKLLIPAARWAPWAAAAVVWLTRWIPDRYITWEAHRGLVGSRDLAALDRALPSLLAAIREATRRGVSGMVDEYRRYYGSWGFDLGEVRQSVTIWQGEQDKGGPDEPRPPSGKPAAGMHAESGPVDGSPASSCRRRPNTRRPRAIVTTLHAPKLVLHQSSRPLFKQTRNLFCIN